MSLPLEDLLIGASLPILLSIVASKVTGRAVRPILGPGAALATLAVALTAATMGAAAVLVLGLPWLHGLLLGAIVSSADAAAVFSVMRARGVGLQNRLRRVLELESGSNDPMAIFLTIGPITLIVEPGATVAGLVPLFAQQMAFGAALGLGLGWPAVPAINRANLACDGLAWLMQITMFLTIGLSVFPSEIAAIAPAGFALALVLILVARPLSVFATLAFSRLTRAEAALVSWVGLGGAVPIILATYPLVAGVPNADLLFNVVFFIVVLSVLLQGPTIPWVARLLDVDEPHQPKPRYPIEFEQTANLDSDLVELVVPRGSPIADRKTLELPLPDQVLVVLLSREGQFLVPRGATPILEGDRLLLLADAEGLAQVKRLVRGTRRPAPGPSASLEAADVLRAPASPLPSRRPHGPAGNTTDRLHVGVGPPTPPAPTTAPAPRRRRGTRSARCRSRGRGRGGRRPAAVNLPRSRPRRVGVDTE